MKKVNLTNWRQTFAWKSPPIYLMAVCCGLLSLLTNPVNAQSITCPGNINLGNFNCNTVPMAPVTQADLEANFNFMASNFTGTTNIAVTNYNAVGGNCGGSVSVNFTVFDDIGDGAGGAPNGMPDTGEVSVFCNLIYTISADIEGPVITCPADDATLVCGDVLPIAEEMLEGTDNCDVATMFAVTSVVDDPLPTTFCTGDSLVVTRTYTVEDACGNEGTCVQMFTFVADTEAPTPTMNTLADIIVTDCNGLYPDPDSTLVTGTDNCSTTLTATFVMDAAPVINGCTESIIRTYNLADECGNSVDVTQTLTRTTVDATNPVITCPAAPAPIEGCDETAITAANADYDFSAVEVDITADVANFTIVEDCVISLTYIDAITDDSCDSTIVVTRTFTVTDGCGNTGTCEQIIEVDDTTDPEIECPMAIEVSGCDESVVTVATATYDLSTTPVDITADTANFTITEACDVISLTYVDVIGAATGCPNPLVVVTRTFTITDRCGNPGTCQQMISIIDDVAPTFTVPADVVIDCTNDPSDLTLTGDVTDEMDNCSIDLEATFVDVISPNDTCIGSSIITRTWSLVDECDNAADNQVQTITVTDSTPPVLVCPDDVADLTCNDTLPALLEAMATDNCVADTDITITFTDDITVADINFCAGGVITRTYTAEDPCGNIAETCVQTFTFVADTEAPVVTCPVDDATLVCGDVLPPAETMLAGIDNCDAATMFAVTSVVDDPLPTTFCTGDSLVVTRTYTVEDACGNEGTCVQMFTFVADTEAPTPTMNTLADIIVTDCNGLYPDPDSTLVTGTDNCSTTLTATFVMDAAPVINGCTESITRTYNLADECGNSVDVTQTLTRTTVDVTDPEITCPAAPALIEGCDETAITAANSGYDFSAVEVDITADVANFTIVEDCVIASLTYIDAITDDSCDSTIVVTRTFTVTDGCGNTGTCEQIIEVDDTTDPEIECPMAIEVSGCDESVVTAATATYDLSTTPVDITADTTNFTITEACDIISLTYVDVIGAATGCPNPLVVVTRTFTITDRCGNPSTCQQMISIIDDVAPTFTAPADVVIDCTNDPSDLTLTGDVTDEMDNCSIDLEATFVDVISPNDTCIGSSIITRTWSLVDECDNAADNQVQTITVTDSTPPVLICPDDVADLTCDDTLPALPEATATDNCVADTDITITFTDDITVADIDFCVGGVITRTYMAEDPCGNVATTCEQTFTFLPGETTIACPAGGLIACSADITVDALDATVTTTCGINTQAVMVSTPVIDGTPDCPGATYTYTYSVTDDCGNTTTCDQVFTIDADNNPVITFCPADTDVTCSADIMADVAAVTFTTTCDVAGITPVASAPVPSPSNSACGETDGDQYTITYTVEDACGRTETCDQIFTIVNTGLVVDCTALMDLTLECDMAADYDMMIADWLTAQQAAMVVTASCTTPTITNDYVVETYPTLACDAGAAIGLPVTFTITDECDNSTTCTVNIFLLDTVAPIVDCTLATDLELECGQSGYATEIAAWIAAQEAILLAQATDACDGGVTVISNDYDGVSEPAVTCPGAAAAGLPVTFTLEDACGNPTECIANIFVYDTTPPVAKEPEDVTGLTCADMLPTEAESIALLMIADECSLNENITVDVQDQPDLSTFTFCEGTPLTVTRTYTITDECDNVTVRRQDFIFDADLTPPTITACPDAEPVILQCGDPLPPVDISIITATDNCTADDDITIIAQDDINPATTISCTGTPIIVTRTFTAIDNCGNKSTCEQIFMYEPDITPPEITVCPLDVVDLQCGATIPEIDIRLVVATDNCLPPESIMIEGSDDLDPATFSFCAADANGVNADGEPAFIVTRTYTAMDKCGNESTCTQQFIFDADIEAPVITTCPADVTGLIPGDPLPVADITAVAATDNCVGDLVVTFSDGPLPVDFCRGTDLTVIRTYTVTDACGNATTCEQNFTYLQESNPPTIVCPTEITVCADVGVCEAVVTWPDPMPMDDCPDLQVIATHNPGDTFPIGNTAVSYTLIDGSGNVTTCKFVVIVEDCEAPVIDCPASPITVSADAGQCTAVVVIDPPATATDNCINVNVTNDIPSANVFPVGTTTVTYTATDDAGNTATCAVEVIVQDNELPTVSCPANMMVSAPMGQCDAAVTWVEPTPADNCPDATIAGSHAPGDVFPVGTTIVTYTVTDAAGNVATCDFNITVTDDEAPVFNCVNGIGNNVELATEPGICGATATWTPPVATDNCGVSVTTSFPPGTIFPVGATAVTYTATDPSGNTAVCKFVVIVSDEELPTITCPADITGISAEDGLCSAVVTWATPVFDDNCPGATVTSTHSSGNAFPVGTTTVTYTVTDFYGNEATCAFDITVTDDEAPEIFCPGDILITTSPGQCEAVLTWIQPVPTDNCDTDITTAVTHKPGTSFPIGTTTVTYTATDDAGNEATCSFDVTVVDDEAPTLTCPANITVSADEGTCEATITWATPVVSDNCPGGVTLTSSHNSGDIFSVGTTTVTYTATDANGRITQCSFIVTVNDDEAPPLTCPADITVSTASGTCGAVVTWTAPEPVMGDCLGIGITVTSNFNPGDTFPLGTTSVIYSAVDGAGNTALCSFNVTVIDNEPPSVVECPADIEMFTTSGMCSAIVEWTPPVPEPMDNCPGVVIIGSTHDSGDSFQLGTTMVTYTIQDASGNIITCSFTVTIIDNETPTIACPTDIIMTNDVGECGAVVTWTTPVPQDNCPGAMIITSSHNPGDFFPVGTTKVVYTMEDATGAVAQCSFFITVQDNNPVLLQCPADVAANTDGGQCTATVFWDAPLYVDNCDETNLSSSHEPGDVFPLGCTTVEYFVTQTIDNQLQIIETCEFEVCVEDNEAPTFDCPTNILIVTDPGECTAFVNWIIPTPSDNCPGAVISGSSHSPGQEFGIGSTTVIYTIDDANGNSELCIFTITVEDGSILDIECPGDINVSTANCQTPVSWTVPVATGNCVGALTKTSTHNPGDIFPIGCTTVTYTVSDIDDNTVGCSFDVCVEDIAGPTLVCPADITVSASSQDNVCGANVVVPVPQFGVDYDDCTSATIINSMNGTNDASAFYPVGVTDVIWTVTDDDGNVTTCEQNITVIDNTVLIVDCPEDITVTTIPGSCSAIVTWNEPDASDNCTEVNSIISTNNSGEAFPVGCTKVTYTVLGGGSAATCSFDVCIEECAAGFNDITQSVAPLIADQDVFIGATDQQSFAANGVYTFTDPATPAGATLSNINLDLFFRVEGASCESDIEVQLTDPSGAIVFTGAPFTTCNGSGTHPAGDLYSTTISIPSATTTGGITNWILQFRDTNDQNTGAVEYSVRFGRINYDYTISVPIPGGCADPVIVNCPSDVSTSATNSCGANLTIPAPVFGVDFTDCTNATITNSYTGTASGSGFYPVGTTQVTWTVTDAGGNTVSCQQSITIVDDVNPSITCPPNITVTTSSGNCDGSVNWAEPNTNDNCGVASVISTHNSGDIFPTGITTVTYTVTDNSGNTAICSFDVTVQDLAELSMVCPSDITAVTQPGQCAATVTWSVPTIVSPCAAASITSNSHAPGMEFPLGCTTVTYAATDDLGNMANCSFEVCVDECSGGGAPTTTTTTTEDITLIDDGDLFVGFNDMESFSSNTTYTFNDPGTPANAVISNATLQLFFRVEFASCESDIEVRLTDPAGNIVFTDSPFATCNGSGANPFPGQLYNVTIPIADGVAMTTGTLANWVVEFRDTDDQNTGGNEYSVRFGRLIYDATVTTQAGGSGEGCGLPLIANCPADITTSATANCAATVNIPIPVFGIDFLDCAGATITNSYTGTADASGTYPLGTTVVTWTVTDTDGNVATCEQSVTLTDEVAPTLACPANITVNTAPGQCDATATWAAPTVSDNCAASMTSRSHNSGDTFPIGCTTVTYTAADDAGNTAECSFEVCVDECSGGGTPGTSTTETITLISDSDLFIGAADAQSFASNGTYTFTDPATAANAVISNATLQLFFRVENASCESDIEIRLTDPTGNVVYTGTLFTACNGSGANPFPGQLYNVTIPITGGNTTGSTANWVLEFRDTNDQNAGAVEYSVRFGRLIYDATVTTSSGEGCGLPAIVNCPADVTVNANSNCEANINISIPVFGVDYLDCIGANIANDYTGTFNASGVYPAGTTVVTWTVTDTDGNEVTCMQNITVLENGCDDDTGEFTSCPGNVTLTTTPGNCGAVATWTPPTVTGGTVTSTHNPGEEFSVGCTTVTYTITGTNATCIFDVCVEECTGANGETTTETITLIDDADAFIGFNDMESFNTNTTYTFNDPGTPTNAVLSNITLQLFFRVENASCESDIEIRVIDPAGNIVFTGPMFNTCNGSGANPFPGQLYQNTISLPGGTTMTTGMLNDWTVQFRDTDDQNVGTSEYSVRFGRLIYDATVTTSGMGGCADPVIINCPAAITADAADGECEAAVMIAVPQFGADFTDCTSATIVNDYTGTANASANYPAGMTTIVWTVTDAQGNTATCEQTITVNPGFIASDAVELISDSDLLIGGADTESFADNGTYLFTDPATPANATLSNINLLLFFRVENASCESDIEIQVTDPAGNVVYLGTPFTTCNGSGANPFPGQLYNTTISIPSASTTGSLANWVVEFRDIDDQNAGAVEYSVRFGRFNYDIGGTLDCDGMMINQSGTSSVTSRLVDEQAEGHDIKLYPVPTMGRLTLEYTADEDEQIQVEIFSTQGQALRIRKENVLIGINIIDMNVYDLPGGMYFVRTTNAQGIMKVKPFTKLAP